MSRCYQDFNLLNIYATREPGHVQLLWVWYPCIYPQNPQDQHRYWYWSTSRTNIRKCFSRRPCWGLSARSMCAWFVRRACYPTYVAMRVLYAGPGILVCARLFWLFIESGSLIARWRGCCVRTKSCERKVDKSGQVIRHICSTLFQNVLNMCEHTVFTISCLFNLLFLVVFVMIKCEIVLKCLL